MHACVPCLLWDPSTVKALLLRGMPGHSPSMVMKYHLTKLEEGCSMLREAEACHASPTRQGREFLKMPSISGLHVQASQSLPAPLS